MTVSSQTEFRAHWANLLETIAARASASDQPGADTAEDILALHKSGWLTACLPVSAGGKGWGIEASANREANFVLRNLGRANLSVARLFEGHMNAVKLVDLYGSSPTAQRIFREVKNGALMGVWGADLPHRPVALTETPAGFVLSGTKQFASGLMLVSQAVICVKTDGKTQLLVAPVDDLIRHDPSEWKMAGMQATASGHYHFDGLALDADAALGGPNAYFTEPYFEGGVWRYCAAHLGGAEALYEGMCDWLRDTKRDKDPIQQQRLVEAALAIGTAEQWIEKAANAVEAARAAPETAIISLMARDVTERSCLTVIAVVEKALGMAAHTIGSDIERGRRDLRLFLCQAAPDAKRMRIAEALLEYDSRWFDW